jgi:UDP-glucose 4-epimerase
MNMEKNVTRVLVTGGAGFIGRALVSICLANGCQVGIYDNLAVGSLANLAPFRKDVTFVQGDICDETMLHRTFETLRPQRVFHLAALHFIPYCNAHPQEVLDVNVAGTFAVTSACTRHSVRTLVFASSGALYASETHPLNEARDLPAPVDVYGLSKLLGEQICSYAAATAGLQCRVARLFNTYGPHETNAHVVPDILEQLHRGDVLELGNIEPKRDYVFVQDTAAALYALSQIEITGTDTFNVGTGQEYSVRELIEAIAQITGRHLVVQPSSARMRRVDKMHQIADIRKLREHTGFATQFSLLQGLTQLLASEGLVVAR